MKRRADNEPEGAQDTEMNQGQQEQPSDGNGEIADGIKEEKPSNYRTRRCIRWAQGNCHLGEACTFLHSGEVGTHFPCRNFLNGYCPRGRLCDFKHDYAMLPPFGASPMMPFHPGVVIPPTKKSNALCRHFEKGYCSLGIACGFQHAAGAAATVSNLPANAKTTQCRHFEKGFCNLGDNCGFAHGDKEGSSKPAPPITPTASTPSNICRHYERGFCRLGQTCGFQHPGYVPPGPAAVAPSYDGFPGPRPSYPQAPETVNPYVNPYTQPSPSFYPPYSPYATPTLSSRQFSSPIPSPSPRRPGTEICRHWAKGYCQLDRKCGFLHPAS